MADYYINSDYGKQLAGSLKAGDMAEASDGSTWRKEADGSVTVWKNGQTMTGRVGVSAPAVSEAPSSSASTTVETPTLDAATGGSSQQTTAADYTGSVQEQRDQEQAQARLASEKAKAATEKVTAGLDQSSGDELLNQAIQQASTPEYKISSAQGVLLADELRMAGDMAEASDGSTWRRESDGSISVRKGDRTYKANIDRAAAKQDPQWAILTAPAPAAAETGSGKKSSRKSSSGSASSGGSGTYTFPAASTGTQKTPTATVTGTDRASLRKQAATAQKEMGDIARQISVAKIRGKDTSALQAKYNEAKARYDTATMQINMPTTASTAIARREAAAEKNAAVHENASAAYKAESIRNGLSTSGARQEQFSQRQTLMELATQQAAERKDAWQSLPTVRDSERFSGIDNVTTGRMRSAEQQQIAGAVKALQKDAWRSLPTVQDSGRFNIPSQTDSLIQQAIAQRQSAAQPQTDKGIGGKLFTMLGAGLGQFNASIANFADAAATAVETVESYLNGGFTKDGKFAKGDSAFTSSLLQPIHDWAKYTQNTSDSLNERSAANWSDTKAGSVANTIGTGVIAALPQAALALLTLGTSSTGTLTQASSSLAGSIETVMRRISSDPSYWLSFMQETGGNFAEAKGAGATDEQAILASTIAGLANAAIEVGGGLENNNWMNDGTLSALSKAKNLIKGAIEEGGEELIQNPISRAIQKLVYDGDREWLSLNNTAQGRDAVFNPYQSAEEFATGAAVGGILGAGNFALDRALGSRSQNQAQNAQLTQDELLDAAMQAANRGETLTGPVQAANQTTQQTTQGTAERGAEGVITRGEVNKNSAAPEQTTVSPINGPVRSDAAEAGIINIAKSSNPVNQNVSATDSTGAAPAGFDPLSHASNQYGAIPPGEKASRVVDIPASMDGETKVRRFTRTAAEAQVTTDEMVNRIENLVADGKLDYEVYGNKQALQDGRKLIEKQYTRGKTIEQIRSDFIRDANNGKGGAKFVSQGTMLYADAIAARDYQTASDILVALAAVETNAGQTVQAARLLKSMSPEGRIFTVQKMVSNLEAQINQRRSGTKQIEINVPDALLNAYQNATTETAQQTALENIYQNIADQVPTTLREGLQQWRYFSMLANPSTHAKNITGNVSSAVAKIGKDNIGALLETIFIGDKPGYRTKAFLNLASEADQNLLNKAWADYDTASELFEDSVGKYSQASGEINDRRRYWKINDPQNAVTKGIDKALGAAEKVADFNTKALEVEDMWFSKPMYATALASYMKANHLTDITDAARTYAMTEAKRGTFNDLNAVSKWASQFGNNSKVGRFLAGTIYPFKKVPANVMVRTLEYSPLGAAKGFLDLWKMSKGNTDYTAAKVIDEFAAGATGSALLAIGIAMAKQGILRATGIGDDEEKEQQKNAFGAKDFSILVGDTYIPIDSFTINGTGLLTGAQIWEAVQNAKNGDEPVSLEDILDALSKITDPVFEQSMLTGLDSVISTIQKSDNTGNGEMAAKLAIQIIGNYIGQYVPTLLGRIASSTDKNQRSTYIEPDGPWDPVQSAIQGVQKKVPGWRQQMAVTYGNWGVPVEGNGAGSTASAIGKAVTPIYPSQKKTDPVEEEIARLHDADSAYANFYKRPSKTISVDGKSVKLTSEQYGNYVVARGQTDYNLRSAMLGNDLYKSLPDQVKSKAMEMSQAYATEIGREAAGVGYQSHEKWVNDLAGKSQDDVLNAVLLRAVESSGYISPETQAQLTKVEQQFGGADYVGLSDELFNSAKEKANTYFSAVEAAKYGGELTETQKELADKDSKELARYFMDKAIESRYTDTNKSGTKADEYLKAYRHGELNDAMALAVLSDKEVMAYDRFGRNAKVTPEMALQAANAHAGMKDVKDEDGKVTSSAQDQFDAWLDKQSWTDDQKSAVRMGFYSDSVKTYSYLADQLRKGNIRTADAKSELTTSYQAGWSKNVRDTGAKMADYIDAIVEYEDRPSKEELDDAGYSYVWQWFCDYLNTTDLTREQKYAMAISIKKNDYGDGTKQKIWNRLR